MAGSGVKGGGRVQYPVKIKKRTYKEKTSKQKQQHNNNETRKLVSKLVVIIR